MRSFSILVILIILSFATKAQDSTFVKISENEIINGSLKKYYSIPTLKELNTPTSYTDFNANYSKENSEKYILQRGSGYTNFSVDIESFQKKTKDFHLWGKFQYKNLKTKDVNFNETLDYDYLYPYIMSDTVGGNLNDEHYSILGGLSKTKNRTTYGLETSFVGKQSVRTQDPRTNNISSNFNLILSLAQQISDKYAIAIALDGTKYFQKANLSFNSELGRPTVFHETGLGNYNKIFADTRDNAEYLGYDYGASIHFIPTNQLGIFAKIKYVNTSFSKKISGVNSVINAAERTNMAFDFGYKAAINNNSNIELGLMYNKQSAKGAEGRFENKNSQTGFTKISEETLFSANQSIYQGYISYQNKQQATIWNAKLAANYIDASEKYILPTASEQFQIMTFSGELLVFQKIAKNTLTSNLKYTYSSPTNANGQWTGLAVQSFRYNMLLNNFNYKNQVTSTIDFSLKLAIPTRKQQTFYLGTTYSNVSVYKLNRISLATGIVF